MKTFRSLFGVHDLDGEHYLLNGKEWILAYSETLLIEASSTNTFMVRAEFLTTDPVIISFHNENGAAAITGINTNLWSDETFSKQYQQVGDSFNILANRGHFLYSPFGQASSLVGADRDSGNSLLGKYLSFAATRGAGNDGNAIIKIWTTRRNFRNHA